MSTEPLLLVAAGGLARETAAAVRAAGQHHVAGFLDDDEDLHGKSIGGVPVLGGLATAADFPDVRLVICAGSGTARSAIRERLNAMGVHRSRYATVVHPSAAVPIETVVGLGTILLAGVVITVDVRLGEHVVVMPNVTLTHDNVIDDFATVCSGVSLGGCVHVGREAYVGMNASIREGLRVGARAVLGMGAVLLCDQPAGETWVGVPAEKIGPSSQLHAARLSTSARLVGTRGTPS